VNYIAHFLEEIAPRETGTPYKTYETPGSKSGDSCSNHPTKPTKPGFVGFVGTGGQETPEITAGPEGIPDRSIWRSVVATWPIERRQKWADLAEGNQEAGMAWKEAEWAAYRKVTSIDSPEP
jgi:hypothetical protein